MVAVATIPDVSQLIAWQTEHLIDAAERWQAIGERSFGVANQVWRDALSVDWQGQAADALRAATHADMLATSAVADQLYAAAKFARSGASELYAARSRLRYAVEDAHAAGFVVREDMSVADRFSGGSAVQRAARQAQAEAFASDIRQRAEQLVALDEQVAARITATVAGVRDTFPASPTSRTPPRKPGVHAVDRHWKQDPTPPDPGADPPWERLPPPKSLEEVREALRQLPRGENKPNRQLETPQDIQRFWDWLTRSAQDLAPRGATRRKQLADGTEIELRPGSKSGGPTIEVTTPGSRKNPKVHLPLPLIDDPPALPPVLGHPPLPVEPPAAPHPAPTPIPPSSLPHPSELPPWLRDPSPPGFTVSPAQPPPVFGWDQPDTPAPPVPHTTSPPPGSHSWLPEIGHDLSEGGKQVFGWVLVGGVLVWTILTGEGQGGEAAVP
ncbi:hypothetical protein [Mycobacterium kubicae]|uniref:hypothetical protein n=1 Tax=Mycobacterium kubicae TaxID=120959 RepID=UPI000801DBDD|nr:hypothetical protein [Mycobacterium kubicae]OBF15972.1 hypothetical protein A5725_03700 [Mycobacterium kubicae]OBK56607.1 hypothetical protein A5657_09375 [Mycobacterium kubicae]